MDIYVDRSILFSLPDEKFSFVIKEINYGESYGFFIQLGDKKIDLKFIGKEYFNKFVEELQKFKNGKQLS